jgi:hypothetical protein
MNTKNSVSAAAVVALGLAVGVPAHADTYNFSYSDSSNNMASGTLTIGSADGSGFDITGITGKFDGYNITGLLAPGACCSPPNNNNILYLSGTYLDLAGLGFVDSQGDSVNMFYWDSDFSYAVIVNNEGAIQGGGTFTLAPSSVPLPAALPLFASGLGALGLLGWRKKRKAAARPSK